jgi:hypothetical protein
MDEARAARGERACGAIWFARKKGGLQYYSMRLDHSEGVRVKEEHGKTDN